MDKNIFFLNNWFSENSIFFCLFQSYQNRAKKANAKRYIIRCVIGDYLINMHDTKRTLKNTPLGVFQE
jgi:hypothetical protein